MSYFVDANIFLRYLTNDVPEQASAVANLLQNAARGELQLVTNAMVMAELIWVMESAYRLPRATIQEYILAMVNTPGLHVTESDMVVQAIAWYVEKNVDFIDAFNASWMMNEEMSHIFTFDKKHFRRFDELTVLSPTV